MQFKYFNLCTLYPSVLVALITFLLLNCLVHATLPLMHVLCNTMSLLIASYKHQSFKC